MKLTFASIAMLLGSLLANATAQQTPIVASASGTPIVAGGYYAEGTTFVNGMAYPSGVIIQASASSPQVYQSNSGSYSYYNTPTYSRYPQNYSNIYQGNYSTFGNQAFGYSTYGLPAYGYSNYGYNNSNWNRNSNYGNQGWYSNGYRGGYNGGGRRR